MPGVTQRAVSLRSKRPFDVESPAVTQLHGWLLAIEASYQHKTKYAGIAQLVEHNLAKVGVASSNLVSRSNSKPRIA